MNGHEQDDEHQETDQTHVFELALRRLIADVHDMAVRASEMEERANRLAQLPAPHWTDSHRSRVAWMAEADLGGIRALSENLHHDLLDRLIEYREARGASDE